MKSLTQFLKLINTFPDSYQPRWSKGTHRSGQTSSWSSPPSGRSPTGRSSAWNAGKCSTANRKLSMRRVFPSTRNFSSHRPSMRVSSKLWSWRAPAISWSWGRMGCSIWSHLMLLRLRQSSLIRMSISQASSMRRCHQRKAKKMI